MRKTGAGAPLREAPKPTIITEDWVKCALKSIYVPYGAPASEKKKGSVPLKRPRAASINLRSLSPSEIRTSQCGEYGVCARILREQQRVNPWFLDGRTLDRRVTPLHRFLFLLLLLPAHMIFRISFNLKRIEMNAQICVSSLSIITAHQSESAFSGPPLL